MDNFQLYRTNVSLGGQMKWDLILDLVGTKLVVKDFNISPISKSIQYDNQNKNSLLNYSHQENVKEFYKNTSGTFYENCVDSKLTSIYPIISDEIFDSHVGDFEMGCKRALYGIYGKQFEFLCPLWLEHLDEELTIEISAYAGTNNKVLQKKLKLSHMTGQKFHNRFVDYFNEYIKFTGIDKGNNDIMYISLNEPKAYVKGLNVSSGVMNTIDISYVSQTLIERERPLMEFDNIITNQLKNNYLITPQLINLNLCFNPEDLLPASFMKIFMGKTISFNVNVYIGNKKLELRDFYSNFEYIPRKRVGSVLEGLYSENSPNVLDYLKDDKCIDIIDKNKMIQNIIHWSIADNNDYIFNVYEGFKGYSIIGDEIINHSHLYDDSPDITRNDYQQSSNSIGWCNYIVIEDSNDPNKVNPADIVRNLDNYLEFSSDFSNDVTWVNKIKYSTVQEHFTLNVLFLLNKTPKPVNFNNLLDEIHIHKEDDKYIIMYENNNNLVFETNTEEFLTFNYIFNLDCDKYAYDNYRNLLTKMKCANSSNNPPVVNIKRSLYIVKSESPKNSTNEITYYKDDNYNEYILRYSGNIKPTFLKEDNDINFNYLYYKDILSSSEYNKSVYNLYSESGYLPKYPSIEYFAIKKTKQDYHYPYNNILNSKEYSWFNSGKNMILDSRDDFEINDDGKETLDVLVKTYLSQKYNITSQNTIDYIYGLYNISSSYDYLTKDDINNFKYNINITMK